MLHFKNIFQRSALLSCGCLTTALLLLAGCGTAPEPMKFVAPEQPAQPAPIEPAPEPEPVAQPAKTKPIAILAWNVESDGSNPTVIADQLAELKGYDIYALSEVDPAAFEQYRVECGEKFKSLDSASGNSDRLQLIYDDTRFELLRRQELTSYQDHVLNSGNLRSPLVAHLKDRDSELEFLVMVNHLARGNEKARNEQAIGLREWARDQSLPCIAVGDYNMDYYFTPMRGNQAFVEMLRDNIWSWVQPEEMIDSNWFDREKDGEDDYPDSLLDFAFVAQAAKTWNGKCKVIVREGDFPDDERTSDHRPVELRLSP